MSIPSSQWSYIGIAFELGFIIALPLLALSQLGKYLDRQWGTDPWMMVVGLALASALTIVWMVRRFRHLVTKP